MPTSIAALASSPGLTTARLERAKLEEKPGDLAAARADYDQVLAEGPWLVDGLVGRARLELEAATIAAADPRSQRGAGAAAGARRRLAAAGTAYRRAGDMQAAASDYGKAIKLRPEEANVYLARASALSSSATIRRP